MDGTILFPLTPLSLSIARSPFRVQIGDQIIEVNGHYMVGVTHQFATNVLKSTSGSIR